MKTSTIAKIITICLIGLGESSCTTNAMEPFIRGARHTTAPLKVHVQRPHFSSEIRDMHIPDLNSAFMKLQSAAEILGGRDPQLRNNLQLFSNHFLYGILESDKSKNNHMEYQNNEAMQRLLMRICVHFWHREYPPTQEEKNALKKIENIYEDLFYWEILLRQYWLEKLRVSSKE